MMEFVACEDGPPLPDDLVFALQMGQRRARVRCPNCGAMQSITATFRIRKHSGGAIERKKLAHRLRESGKKWADVADELGVSIPRARDLAAWGRAYLRNERGGD